MDRRITISSSTYHNNLQLYSTIKTLINKFSDAGLVRLQTAIDKCDDIEQLWVLFDNFADNTNRQSALSIVRGLFIEEAIEKIKDMLNIAIDLLLIKDLIIAEAKSYANFEFKNDIQDITDCLSLSYDTASLCLPYGHRVASALIWFALSFKKRESEFILSKSSTIVSKLNSKISNLEAIYDINITSILQIVLDECVSQSIRSSAGQSWEQRVRNALSYIVENIDGHSHDKNIPSVEYDNIFICNGKRCGVSAKRTLRERYKQNHDDVQNLEVDYMFVITLGIDLDSNKLDNILSKQGNFVIVSAEQYKLKSYFFTNPKVISSDDIKLGFDRLIV